MLLLLTLDSIQYSSAPPTANVVIACFGAIAVLFANRVIGSLTADITRAANAIFELCHHAPTVPFERCVRRISVAHRLDTDRASGPSANRLFMSR